MASTLGAKSVGSTVKLKVNGTLRNFIVVNQGKPSSMYDASCDGTWLLMQDCYENRQWHSSNVNKLESSTIHSYLNSTFLNLIDANIRAQIKTVKLPYHKNGGSGGTTQSGANGLPCHIFLLSASEVNLTYPCIDSGEGACLAYFNGCATDAADSKRIANLNGSTTTWWLRSPYIDVTDFAWSVFIDGGYNSSTVSSSLSIRPAFVLPTALLVSDDGTIKMNTAPTIASTSGSSGVKLGTKSAAFSFQYTPSDADGDTLTVTEKLDGVTKKTRANVASGTQLTFECASAAAAFQQITNGAHTIAIEASDGKETASFTASFTKSVTQATVTLKTPLAVSGDIDVAVLAVTGSIPSEAAYKVEVTNNAKDSAPVWQDATNEVRSGANIVFTNHTCANGAAFNFRITVKRGSSNTGGYISAVTGAFQ